MQVANMKSVVEQINIDHVPLAILVVAVWFLMPQNIHTELQSDKKNFKNYVLVLSQSL